MSQYPLSQNLAQISVSKEIEVEGVVVVFTGNLQ